jgi:hypothetical protein
MTIRKGRMIPRSIRITPRLSRKPGDLNISFLINNYLNHHILMIL